MGAYISHWYLEYIFGIHLSPKISKNFSRGANAGVFQPSPLVQPLTLKTVTEGGFEGCEIPMDVWPPFFCWASGFQPFFWMENKKPRELYFFFGGGGYI